LRGIEKWKRRENFQQLERITLGVISVGFEKIQNKKSPSIGSLRGAIRDQKLRKIPGSSRRGLGFQLRKTYGTRFRFAPLSTYVDPNSKDVDRLP
jgi:hypothetical protein